MEQKTGIMAILSIVAAIASFLLTLSGQGVAGMLTAIVAILFGVVGLVMAASPRISGGILSIISILVGIFAVGLALLVTLGALVL